MNTYTIRALTSVDAATVQRVAGNHADYRAKTREGIPFDHAPWAGIFEVNVSELLEIIERLTRPAGYQYTITCCEDVDVYTDRETACKCGCTFRATGPNPPAPLPARSRVARMTGTGWPA